FTDLAPYYRIDLEREGALDSMAITVEHERAFDGDVEALEARLHERLANVLGLTPDDVTVAASGTLERTETGKATRVYDHRG
ncbi:MAG TPA: phenylacetate--CoA ligase, partial [Halobacteriales archaeon]|nr:phenylacetate--CoA ligase [Halobacteriales archaeon]